MKARIFAALACVVVALPVYATEVMVMSQIYRSCRAPKVSSSYTYCRAYVGGYFDGFRVGMDTSSPNKFCPGPDLTTERIWKKLEPSLKPRREHLVDELAVTVLADRLVAAYRCKKGNSSSNKRADTKLQSELYAACQAPKKSSSHMFCRGYLEGHLDGLKTGLAGMMPKQFCPEAYTAEQIWETAGPFLKPRQGQLGDEAADTVLSETLLSFYPCAKPT
jgi:hypothetical protein